MGLIEWLKEILCGEEIMKMKEQIQFAYEDVDELNKELNNLYNTYDILKHDYETLKEPDQSEQPTWLDTSTGQYNPNVMVFEKDISYWVEIDAQDMYTPSVSLQKLVEQKKWIGMPLNQKLVSIWSHVINHLKYRYDQSDSWEYPTTTHFRKKGDCEDGTIYFLTLCRVAKVPADRVFNALGKMGTVGHSWPIVKLEDDKWYIMETTIDFIPDHAMLFEGSTYKASYGLQNWRWMGGIKNGKEVNWQI